MIGNDSATIVNDKKRIGNGWDNDKKHCHEFKFEPIQQC